MISAIEARKSPRNERYAGKPHSIMEGGIAKPMLQNRKRQ
jgi:hypothetical protein